MPRGDNWKHVVCEAPNCETKTYSDGRYCAKHYQRLKLWGSLERDWDKILSALYQIDSNGCWLWEGRLMPDGYVRKNIETKTWSMHRYMYTRYKGEIPKGLQLDHLCRVRHCINPKHLEPVTLAENVARGIGPTAKNKAKLLCIRGHDINVIENCVPGQLKKGHRICRLCNQIRYEGYKNAAVQKV